MSDADRLRRIKVLDDDEAVRSTYAFCVDVAGLEPVSEKGPLGPLDSYLRRPLDADAAVTDHQLRPSGYAAFDGADLVAAWYRDRVPAILCTTFAKSNADQLRSLRRWIPVVMSPTDLDPDSLMRGLEYAQDEIAGKFIPPRRPWRSLVHFVDYESATETTYLKLPAWGLDAVALRVVDLPLALQDKVRNQVNYRCYAMTNLGAEANDDLYLSEWEVRD